MRTSVASFTCRILALTALPLGWSAAGAELTRTYSLVLDQAPGWTRHTIDNSSTGADGVKLGDINGDGRPDIVTGWEEGGTVRYYRNPGILKVAEPWPQVTVGNVESVEDAVFVDLDGDGRLEVVSATEGNNRTVFIHWADDPKFNQWTTQALPCTQGLQSWLFVLPMDVDRKNGIDLVVGSKENSAAIGWLEAPANPRDAAGWKYHSWQPASWIMSLLSVDMNQDGYADVLFSDRGGPHGGIGWLENPGPNRDADSVWREHRVAGVDSAAGFEALFVDHADVDGDGKPEIVAAYKPTRIGIFRQRGPDQWDTQWLSLSGEMGATKAVKVADLNGDGRKDLVVSLVNAKGPRTGVVWIEQTQSGGWLLHPLGGPAGVKYDLVNTLDLDGDGDLDVITTEETEQLGVIWYENPTRRVGDRFVASDVDRDHPVYISSFDSVDAMQDWRLEGGRRMTVENGNLVLESIPGNDDNHLVCWLAKEVPADFLLEFTVSPRDRKEGLNIVFFGARGRNGKSIFDPTLKRRDGTYSQYNRGDIDSYHVSYWAAGRETANMRKSYGFHLVGEGRDLIHVAPPAQFQTVRIYKNGGTIRVTVDDVLALAYDDDGHAHGPVLSAPGFIGLRQMGKTQRCEYGQVAVFPLRKTP